MSALTVLAEYGGVTLAEIDGGAGYLVYRDAQDPEHGARYRADQRGLAEGIMMQQMTTTRRWRREEIWPGTSVRVVLDRAIALAALDRAEPEVRVSDPDALDDPGGLDRLAAMRAYGLRAVEDVEGGLVPMRIYRVRTSTTSGGSVVGRWLGADPDTSGCFELAAGSGSDGELVRVDLADIVAVAPW